MRERSPILVYSIINEDSSLIDSPALDILDPIIYFSYLKNTQKDKEIFLYVDPIGLLDETSEINLEKIICNPVNFHFHYSSFHRYNGLKNKNIENIVRAVNPKSTIIFSDMYSGSFNYIDYSERELKKYLRCINQIYRYDTMWGNNHIQKIFPDLNLFRFVDIDKIVNYLRSPIQKDIIKDIGKDENVFPYKISIGCNYKCKFCSGRLRGWVKREMSLISEDLWLLKSHRVDRLVLLDQYANYDSKFFNSFLRLAIKYGFKLHFANGIGILHLNEETVELLNNCVDILYLSPEVGSDKSLKILNKPFNIEIIEKRLKLLSTARFKAVLHCLYNIPSESKKDAIESFERFGRWIEEYNTSIHLQPYVKRERLYAKLSTRADLTSLFKENLSKKYYIPLKRYIDLSQNKNNNKLIINVSYRCNNNCIFCSVGDRRRTDGDLQYQLKMIKDFYKDGYRLLDIDGGEPLMYAHLERLIEYAAQMGYERINITTNGRLLVYDKYIDILKKYQSFIYILISLHSSRKDIQYILTRNEDSFNQTIIGIRNILTCFQSDKVGINFTITSINYKELKNIIDLALKVGITNLTIQKYTPFGNVNKSLRLPKSTSEYIEECVRYAKSCGINIRLVNFEFCFNSRLTEFMYDDYFKSKRFMLFVDNRVVNLMDFLSQKRRYLRRCKRCEYRLMCSGFWIYD